MDTYLSNAQLLTFAVGMFTSILCGGLIGLEREWARKQAGLRTMILICLGSTLYISVSQLIASSAGQPFDVTRIASQVVTGVGFIGAGAIIQARGQVHGLTTAATIWTVAAIGLLIGAGFPVLGLLVTLVVLIILAFVYRIERYFVSRWIKQRASDLETAEDDDSDEV
jgi:putative Mg2+ transporter-C (MgtC) family protein